MGIKNKEGALYFATGIDNSGLYNGRKEAMGIIKAMAGEITSFDVFGGIGISAGIAFTKAATNAYKFEKQFQQSMKEVATLSSGIKGNLTDWMNQVSEMTTKIPVGADEAAKALYQIVSAGYDGADGMKILEQSAKAAIGGVTDTATAADTITTMLNAYKENADQAGKVSDYLFTAVKLGKTNFTQLGQSIAQVAPIAASYGVEMDQVLAAVASLTKQGTPTAQAMTQIRAAIIGTSKVLGDGAFEGRTFQEALSKVAEMSGGSESKLRELMPEIEGVNGLLGLTGRNAKTAAQDLSAMSNSVGSASDAYEEMASSAENQTKIFANNVTNSLRPLGTAIMESISDMAEAFNKAFDNGDIQASMKAMGEIIVVLTSAMIGYKGSIAAVTTAKAIQKTVTMLLNQQRTIEAANLVLNKGLYAAEATMVAKNTGAHILLTNALKAQFVQFGKNAAIMLTNPYVLAAAAVAALGFAVYKYATYESEAEKATNRLNEANKSIETQVTKETSKLSDLNDKLQQNKKGSNEWKSAKDAIVKQYGQYFNGLDKEIERVGDLSTSYNTLTENIRKAMAARNLKTFVDKEEDNASDTITSNLQDVYKQLKAGNSDKVANVLISNIRDYVFSGKELSDASRRIISRTNKGLYNQITDARKANTSKQSNIEDYKKIYGISDEEANNMLFGNNSVNDDTNNTKTSTHNKAYWGKQKKDAQTKLDALSNIEAKGKAGAALRKKIKEYDKELAYYSATSTTKEYDKEKKNVSKSNQLTKELELENQKNSIAILEESREKKLKQIDLDYEAQKNEIIKKSKELSDTNKDAGLKGLNSNGLTSTQQTEIDNANKINEESKKKSLDDLNKSELESMQEYLKQYGTFQQQKLAIAEEYTEKIRKAQTEGEKMSLEKEKNTALLNVDARAAQQNIDWQNVFGDLGSLLKEQIQPTVDNLKKVTESSEFKNSSAENQQIIYDLISKLEKETGTISKNLFKDVATDLERYRKDLNAYNEAQQREIEASNKLLEAKKNLAKTQAEGGDVKAAEMIVQEAQEAFDYASNNVQVLGEKADKSANDLTTSTQRAKGALENLSSGLDKLKSGSLSQAFDGIKDIGKTLGGKLGDAISNIDPTGIIGAVLSILDILKDGISSIFVSLQDTIFGAIEGILNDVLSGDIIMKPLQNSLSHVGNILNTVTFGGLNSWLGVGGNSKETADTIAKLTSSNEALKVSIDSLKDEIKGSNGSKSIDAYKESVDSQKRYESNLQGILNANMNYHSAHHSNASYWNMNGNSMNQINSLLGTSLNNSWSDFSKLTADQMDDIRKHLPDIWSEMINQGKYGDRFKDDWNNYADQAGKVKELTQDLQESLTQISFDSLRDSFVDKLMDMKSDAADFADDFSEYMTKAMLNFAVGDQLDTKIKEWYEDWAEAVKIKDEEEKKKKIDELRKRWGDLSQEGIDIRNGITDITGYTGNSSYSQEASSKGFNSMSQDTGNELNGRFTAIQINGEKQLEQAMIQVGLSSDQLRILQEIYSMTFDSFEERHDQMVNIVDYLQGIKKDTGYLPTMSEDIKAIKKNLIGS